MPIEPAAPSGDPESALPVFEQGFDDSVVRRFFWHPQIHKSETHLIPGLSKPENPTSRPAPDCARVILEENVDMPRCFLLTRIVRDELRLGCQELRGSDPTR